jgi:hydroxyethylthiazole kinase
LDASFITLSKKAMDLANEHNKPIVLDPVGAGATKIRTETAKDIAPLSTIIRGNASEIMALGKKSYSTKGVESAHKTDDAKEIANSLALKHKTTVIVSGAVDFVTDGIRSLQVAYGSPLMQLVTGMGCSVTAVIAAFKTVVDDPFEASLIGVHYFTLCGEIAALKNKHPGGFRSDFIDQLHLADFEMMSAIYDK